MSKYIGHGTTLSINSVLIGGLVSVGVPEQTKGEAEVTDSDSGNVREFIAGLRDSGSMELTVRHDPDDAGQQEIESNYAATPGSEIVEFVITLPDAATSNGGSRTYTFDGYVQTSLAGDLELADDTAAELTCTVRVTGAVTIAP